MLGLVTSGCVSKRTAQDLQSRVARLERENFQLRKDLTEARVRLEVEGEGQKAVMAQEAAPVADASPGPEVWPLEDVSGAAGMPDRVLYSEPITDVSRYASGSIGAAGGDLGGASGLMERGIEEMGSEDVASALSTFQRIANEYPQDALADDAQFGIGEAYFQMRRYEEALEAYRKVVNEFPFGDQVASAYLKIGFSYLALGERDLALDSFRAVSDDHPGTEAATVARQQMEHLKSSAR